MNKQNHLNEGGFLFEIILSIVVDCNFPIRIVLDKNYSFQLNMLNIL